MTDVVCNMKDRCDEAPMCGGAVPHRYDDEECGRCPRDSTARCLPVESLIDEMKGAIGNVLDADGDLDAMDFDELRRVFGKATEIKEPLVSMLSDSGFQLFERGRIYACSEEEFDREIADRNLPDGYVKAYFDAEMKTLLDFAADILTGDLGNDSDSDAVHCAVKRSLVKVALKVQDHVDDEDPTEGAEHPASREYMCRCAEKELPLEPVNIDEIEHLPLKGGRHTSTSLNVCSLCGRIVFFPKENWEIFLTEGVDEAVADWERMVVDFVAKYRKKQPTMKRVRWYLKRRSQR